MEGISIVLASGLIGAIIAYPVGSFAGWQKHRRALHRYRREKAAEQTQQKEMDQPKREAYDFTHDETIQFPCIRR